MVVLWAHFGLNMLWYIMLVLFFMGLMSGL